MLRLCFYGRVERENRIRVLTKLSNLLMVVALLLNKRPVKVVAFERGDNYEVFLEEGGLIGRVKTLLKLRRDYLLVVLTAMNLIEEKNPSDFLMRYLVEDFLQACYETEGVGLRTEGKELLIKENYLG